MKRCWRPAQLRPTRCGSATSAYRDNRANRDITFALRSHARRRVLGARTPTSLHSPVTKPIHIPLQLRFDRNRHGFWSATLVQVPWERFFLHNNGKRPSISSSANFYQNHNPKRALPTKMGLIAGFASRMCSVERRRTGFRRCARRCGRLAALRATVGRGLSERAIEPTSNGPRLLHARPGIITPAQLVARTPYRYHRLHCARSRAAPAGRGRRSSTSFANPELKDRFERWWLTPRCRASIGSKLYKLVWAPDRLGFAGRGACSTSSSMTQFYHACAP